MPATRKLPDQITIPNWNAYQVRIVRNGHEYSASFSWSHYGGTRKALSAAVKWRDSMMIGLPPAGNATGGFRQSPLSHKSTWGRVGVTCYTHVDKRKAGHPEYLRFGVNWTDATGKRRTKSFQAGPLETLTPADKLHAANTANAFRTEWEHCQSTGTLFDPARYADWRQQRLYPFRAK